MFADSQATLLEVILMLCAPSYRSQVAVKIKEPRLRDLWRDFDSMSAGMRAQIAAPILSRLDQLLGHEAVANCLLQRPKTGPGNIDFRAWADGDEGGPYCIIMRVPKGVLGEDGTDALVTYLIAKLWLAVLTRHDQPTGARRPCYLIMDEPHQFLSSAKGGVRSTWGSMLVESRKWRLGLVFMLHDWGQLGRELGGLLKSAGPHYVLYSSSKETYQALAEEITPFSVEEALETPVHSALCVVRSERELHRFMAAMQPPPVDVQQKRGWRYGLVDRSHRTGECSRIFGRPVADAEEDIYQRERVLYRE